MVLKAVFIGINKHSDPRVNELSAATKDAIALWALFKDSVQGISDKRLLDDEATARGIRQALDESLGDAGKEEASRSGENILGTRLREQYFIHGGHDLAVIG